MNLSLNGRCLCGQASYSCEAEPIMTGHCHCVDCRKSSGTGHCTHVALMGDQFKVEGEVRFFTKPADSGNLVSRGFCPTCGSPLYSTNAAMPGMIFIRASSLDNPEAVTPTLAVYDSRAVSWDVVGDVMRFAVMPEGGPKYALET